MLHRLEIRNLGKPCDSHVCNNTIINFRPGKEGKEFGVSLEDQAFVTHIKNLLEEIQTSLYEEAKSFQDSNIKDVESYEGLKDAIQEGFWARGPWAGENFSRTLFKIFVIILLLFRIAHLKLGTPPPPPFPSGLHSFLPQQNQKFSLND